MKFLDAAYEVLKAAGAPLHHREIVVRALEHGLIRTKGKTPAATLNAQLGVSIKRAAAGGPSSRFCRVNRGVFGLVEWQGIASTAARSDTPTLAELFHLVSRVVPKDQQLEAVAPDDTVATAISKMLAHNYSQLPVMQGRATLGVFCFRSFAEKLLEMGDLPKDVGSLPVSEFMQEFRFVNPSDTWESTLEYIDKHDAVLVGTRYALDAILTSMDVLNYLRDIANPFVMLEEIELSLRSLIGQCAHGTQLKECIERSLAQKYSTDELPGQLQEMTFDDYGQVITNGHNWPTFSSAFGKGEWQRKSTARRLKQVTDLRNDVFHFRRKLTSKDHKLLADCREWLQTRIKILEAKKRAAQRPKPKVKPPGRKVDRETFLNSLDEYGRDFFVDLLGYADRQRLPLSWGTKGFSLNAEVAGRHVPLLYCYPPHSSLGQSIYTSAYDIVPRVKDAESIAQDYLSAVDDLGLFQPAGKSLKWMIKETIGAAKKEQLFEVLSDVVKRIKERGLKE